MVAGNICRMAITQELDHKNNEIDKGRTIRKVMGVGNFGAAGTFFRHQIPCMNFFVGHSMNIF